MDNNSQDNDGAVVQPSDGLVVGQSEALDHKEEAPDAEQSVQRIVENDEDLDLESIVHPKKGLLPIWVWFSLVVLTALLILGFITYRLYKILDNQEVGSTSALIGH